ncbi:MAG: hypothetical protein FWD68_10620 [Alphaproteobacteria bacterium]|nr:hypothetical protein [Alphaproteobacteria bacterium]
MEYGIEAGRSTSSVTWNGYLLADLVRLWSFEPLKLSTLHHAPRVSSVLQSAECGVVQHVPTKPKDGLQAQRQEIQRRRASTCSQKAKLPFAGRHGDSAAPVKSRHQIEPTRIVLEYQAVGGGRKIEKHPIFQFGYRFLRRILGRDTLSGNDC